ncbi:hypothetical protein Glove_5g81 [Diversispora epigaea]|uniref:Uncharacterized protein n=1 Tax=Diversispora epigaea TaxID=1348612 RepID=A0A397JP98_9GLOM|nr:hypothetical protein Glove_5g81 [Diversispora epigaea]
MNRLAQKLTRIVTIRIMRFAKIQVLDVKSSLLHENKTRPPISTLSKENIRDNVKGEWDGGEYINTKTYRLSCWKSFQNAIQIIMIKA